MLTNTEAAAASTGPSKAKYTLADGTADRVHAAAAEILAANPLYPGYSPCNSRHPAPDFEKGVNVGYSYFHGTETCS